MLLLPCGLAQTVGSWWVWGQALLLFLSWILPGFVVFLHGFIRGRAASGHAEAKLSLGFASDVHWIRILLKVLKI